MKHRILSSLDSIGRKVEMQLVGPLDARTRRTLRTDLLQASLYGFLGTILTFIPAILRRLGAPASEVALYSAASYIGLITASVSTWLMRRFGMRRVAVLSWLASRAVLLLGALATDSAALLVIMTIFFLFDGWTGPAYTQTLRSVYPDRQRGRAMAMARLGMTAVLLIFTPIAGLILDHLGYRALLPLGALAGIAAALTFSRIMASAGSALEVAARPRGSPWKSLRANRPFLIYLGSMLLFGLAGLIPNSLYPLVQVDRLNLSYTELGALGLAQSAAWLTGYLFVGRIVDRLGGARTLLIAFTINALVMSPYIIATQGWMLLPAFVAAGLVSAGVDVSVTSTLLQLAEPDRIPDYATANSTLVGARGIFAPFLGPILLAAGVPAPAIFALGAGLTLAAALVLSRVRPPPSQPA